VHTTNPAFIRPRRTPACAGASLPLRKHGGGAGTSTDGYAEHCSTYLANFEHSHPQAALEAATRISSVPSGGILNPPPRLLVEDESGGGLGMVLSLAKHVHAAYPPADSCPPGGRQASRETRGRALLLSQLHAERHFLIIPRLMAESTAF
jgi:hypothetical protein